MNINPIKTVFFAGAFGAATLLSMSVHAMTSAEHSAVKVRADADYKGARERCKPLRGNDQDVCEKEVKAAHTKTVADADAEYKNTPRARSNAAEEKAEANYKVAKEKCDAMTGNAKDVCVEQAKANRTKTMAGATEQRKVSDARNEASHAKQEADSRVAMERCDAMSGDAKERCRADAKKMISK